MATFARIRWTFIPMVVVAALLLALSPRSTSAHPLGNFTVNQYSRIEATTAGLRLVYVLDLAEIPAFQEIEERIDADGDGTIAPLEEDAYLAAKLAEIGSALHLTIDGDELSLRVVEADISFPEGQAGLRLVRLQAVFAPRAGFLIAAAPRAFAFRNDYATDRVGWREIVVTHGGGVRLEGAGDAWTDRSDGLRAYPEDMLGSPLDETDASFRLTLAADAPAGRDFARFALGAETTPADEAARPGGGASGDRLARLVEGRLSAAGIVAALLAAMVWGAAHALSPGHGKTVVGAYLVGSRGTPRHAAFLGLTVTITHTAGVLALGLVTLFASRFIVPAELFPWLSVASGLLVVALGLYTFRQRLRGRPGSVRHHHHAHAHDHDHDHDHSHGGRTHSHLPPGADGGRITWRALLALGVSGGLIPCPSALVVLLGSIALGRVGFGLALVVAFSLGLAATLTGLGLLFLYAGRFFERRARPSGRLLALLGYAPAAGSLVLTAAGLAIIVRALGETGFR